MPMDIGQVGMGRGAPSLQHTLRDEETPKGERDGLGFNHGRGAGVQPRTW